MKTTTIEVDLTGFLEHVISEHPNVRIGSCYADAKQPNVIRLELHDGPQYAAELDFKPVTVKIAYRKRASASAHWS